MNKQYHHNQIHLDHVTRKVKGIKIYFIFIINSLLGKQKWLPMPLDNNQDDTPVVPSANVPNNAKPFKTKGTRGGRGGTRNRTRSLDGAAAKRNRKNRPAVAPYNAYQDYYSYYCMFYSFEFEMIISFL
jgi:hypothetical protein